jgi:hypothetical protein
MVFILPFLLGAVALITATGGVVAGADGVSNMKKANNIGKDAQKRYEHKQNSVKGKFQATQNLAAEYGQIQIKVKLETIGRFIAFIEQIGQHVSVSDMEFLEGLEGVSSQQIQEYKTATLEAEHFLKGGFKAVGAGYAAGQSAVALVGLFGTASTGAAIGGLSGAAAWSSTLAWLGGGSLAAGGGGMALGTFVLGGIALAPALMIGGFVLGGQGEKALTKARIYESKINTEMAKLDTFEDYLGQVQRRIIELKDLVDDLNNRAVDYMLELESKPFVREQDAAKFQQVAFLIKALSEIMKIPPLDSAGNLNHETTLLRAKYRNI